MTAKEKAKELVFKYYNAMNPDAPDCSISFRQSKQCALIAVDEMIEWSKQFLNEELLTHALLYLEEVKQEIEKL